MTVPPDAPRTVNAGRLWTGGVATALVAALVALVGVLIARGLLDVPVLAPTDEGTLGNAKTLRLAVLAALAALLATGLLHLLLLSTPQPRRFFSWIMALATVAAALAPFLTDADLDQPDVGLQAGHHPVGGQDDLGPAAQGLAVGGGHHRPGRVAQHPP